VVQSARIAPVRHLTEVVAHLRGSEPLQFVTGRCHSVASKEYPDLAEVRGQGHARRAIEIAAAGNHSALLVGSPGTGKSMLAKRLPGILPPLSEPEALEVATIASMGGKGFDASEWCQRPFRSPHHSCSAAALIGGGSVPRPGEISLAHLGVLFLDELPEFDREALECLREPLENGHVSIARAAHHTDYPARFQLIAAMNPCPCGYLGEDAGQCRCTPGQIQRYQARISGPLLDRLDLHVRMESVEPALLLRSAVVSESSAAVAARILAAREIQMRRQRMCNANLDSAGIERVCNLTAEGSHIVERALQRFGLSVRGYHRVLKVARTVADLEGAEQIGAGHVSEALLFRQLDSLNFCVLGDRSYVAKEVGASQELPVRH
jgi:magnesium chelatase family protein